MKQCVLKCILVVLIIFANHNMEAQRLGKLLKDVSKDISTGVTDVLADKLADEIVERVMDKFSARLDTVLQEAYQADTTGRDASVSYSDFLANMDESDKVSDSYNFDLSTKQEVLNPDESTTYSTNYYTKDGRYLGIQMEDMFLILDSENKIMITFSTEEKTAYAFGQSLLKYSSKLVPNNVIPNYILSSSSGNKEILGYDCNKYIGESDNGDYQIYVAEDFPISMKNIYGAVGKAFFDDRFNESFGEIDGIALESIYTETNGDVTHSTVTSIDNSTYTFDTTEYKFGTKE